MEPSSSGPPVRPLLGPAPTGSSRLDALARLVAIVDRLRAPDGCPWDREQSLASMAPSLIEEAHECVEAIEDGDQPAMVEEAGDLLMVIVLLCRIAQDEGRFDLADVGRTVAEKLVRRHPHVFGTVEVEGAEHAVANWERIKAEERRAKRADDSALAGIPRALPPLQRARRMGEKAIAAGFRWTSAAGALDKLREEVDELAEVLAEVETRGEDEGARERLEHELGDVLLAASLLGNYVAVDADRAAREAVRRFERRFRAMEAELGGSVRDKPLAALLEAWRRAKS